MNKKMKRQKSILPGKLGVRVVKTKQYPNGDINFALRSFKKELKQSGKLEELRERRYFIPKSAKKREQMKRAKYFQWVDDQNRF
jgi:ribosomal protein S21